MPTQSRLLHRLEELVPGLPDGRLGLLTEMATALGREVVSEVATGSDLATPAFDADFSGRLLLFHAMHDAPLTKKTFEYTFVGALRADGREAHATANAVHAGEDVVADGVKFSLKTEGGKSIRRDAVHISKLMEARWIRECRTGRDFAAGVREHVVGHLQHYERIVTLRSFRGAGRVTYELVEIPRDVLLRVGDLRARDFSPRTRSGGSGVTVTDEHGDRLFTLTIDGGSEKITVGRLTLDACEVHAAWTVELT